MSYRINPIVIIIYNIFLPIALMIVHGKEFDIYFLIISSLFLIYTKNYKRLVKIFGFYFLFCIFYYVCFNSKFEPVQFIGIMFLIIIKFMPCFMASSVLIYDYKTSEILSSLESLRLPKLFIIALTVTIRYIPTFGKEFGCIKESMRLRGIPFTIKRPLKSFEYFIVPQLFRCMILADELTSAGLCKGIDNNKIRTSYYDVKFKTGDLFVLLLIVLGWFGVMIWIK